MKILIVTDNYYPNVNGSSYSVQRLAHYLKQRGHEILVLTTSRSMRHEPSRHNNIDIFGVRSYPILVYPGFRFSLPIGIKNIIESEIKRFKPDVIHVNDHFVISPVVQRIAKQLSIPMIGTNHFMPENLTHYLHLPKNLEKRIASWAWSKFRKVFEELDVVTTPTKTAAELLKQVKLTKPVLPVSNGVDLQKFRPQNNGEYLKKQFNLPNKPTLLYVGRLDKEKNLDVVLKSLPKVLQQVDMHFVIAGKGAEMQKLKTLSGQLKISSHVTFAGFIPDEDLPNLYTIADCFIIAGIAELQSLVTMEAMASSLPVVGVNAMALPELIHDGENGYLFELNNLADLSDKLIKIFSDQELRKQMAYKSLEIIQKHDIKRSIAIFESIYEKMLRREPIAINQLIEIEIQTNEKYNQSRS